MFSFRILHADPGSEARRGRLETPHGVIDTPAFLPVATCGSIKGVSPDQVHATGTQMILANTYHLHQRPTEAVIQHLGGISTFCGWHGPVLTDSGGYQVFSLARIRRIDDDGVDFQSHIDGARLRLDPRLTTAVQNKLGADIILPLDQCPPIPCRRAEVEAAVERTVRWARVGREAHGRDNQWMFGIVQGGLHLDLRRRCAEELLRIGFDGYAIGGLSVGERHDEMVQMVHAVTPLLPADRPRHLLGVGMPADIYQAVRAGVDLFDCVLPTRNGRNAYAFTARGPLRLRNERYKLADGPLEDGCDCYACRNFSLGYVRHLFVAGEMLGPMLASIHNLRFYQRFMARIRALIPAGELATITREFPVVCEPVTARE